MDEVKFNLNDKGHGAFYIMDVKERIGEMDVGVAGENLLYTAPHG